MAQTTVRIRRSTRDLLRAMAEQSGESMQAVLEKAIEAYRRQRFLEDVNAAYAELRSDDARWAVVREERAEWDATLEDGLPPDESRSSPDENGTEP